MIIKRFFIFYRHLLPLILSLFIVAFIDKQVLKNINHLFTGDVSQWQVGDLVLRMGKDVDSHIITQIGKGRFSHIGMVVQTSPDVIIVHATTDDNPALLNQVITTPLSLYLSSKFASSYALARLSFLTLEQRKKIALNSLSRLGQEFRLTKSDNQPFYCTTFLLTEIQEQEQEFSLDWKDVQVPAFKGSYLFPDAYLQHPNIVIIEEASLHDR